MRTAIIVLCFLVAGGGVYFGFWWKTNVRDPASSLPAQFDEPADITEDPAVIEASSPAPNLSPVADNGSTAPATTPRQGAAESGPDSRLLEMLASSDDDARCEALRELGKREDTDPKLLTEALTTDPSPKVRKAAARGLGQLQNREAIPELIEALEDEDVNVRVWAITALNKTLVSIRFPYNADAPREERLLQIENIRTHMKRLEAYRASQP